MGRPILEAAAGLVAGLSLAAHVPDGATRLVLAATGAGLVVIGRRRIARGRLFALSVALGLLGAARPGALPPDDIAAAVGPGAPLVAIEGRVEGPADPTRSGLLGFAIAVDVSGGSETDARSARGTVRVLLARGDAPLPGDRVRIVGRIRHPRGPTNPGERTPSIPGRPVLVVEDTSRIQRIKSGAALRPGRIVARLREWADSRIHAALPSADGAVARGLLIGRRAAIPTEVEEDFRRSGTVHLLAVSGLHVGLVAAAALGLGRLLTRSETAAVVLAVFAAATYAGLAGLRPPVVRAAILCALLAGGRLFRRRTSILELLAAAALIVLLARPDHLRRVDFQLSFTAVLGIVLLTPRITAALFPQRDIARRFSSWHRVNPLRRWLRDHVHRVLPATWAAWLATAPLVLGHFGVVSPAVLLGNLLLLPLLVLSLAASGAAAVLGPVAPGVVLAVPIRLLRGVAGVVAALPGAAFEVEPPGPVAVLLTYAGIVGIATRAKWRRAHLAAATALPVGLVLLALPRSLPEEDRLTLLDVGQGACAVLERSSGEVAVIDAGSTVPGVGRRRIEPFLRTRRIRRIDTLVLSHDDSDHVSAAPRLLERHVVGELVVPERFGESPLGRSILTIARARAVPIRRVRAGDALPRVGRVVHPTPDLDLGDNDGSLVLLLEIGSSRVLVPGDLEEVGIETLLATAFDVSAEVLVLPHHGARNARLRELIAAVRPEVILASASAGFPSEPLPPGFTAWRTAEHGAITLTGRTGRVRVEGFRTGSTFESRAKPEGPETR